MKYEDDYRRSGANKKPLPRTPRSILKQKVQIHQNQLIKNLAHRKRQRNN